MFTPARADGLTMVKPPPSNPCRQSQNRQTIEGPKWRRSASACPSPSWPTSADLVVDKFKRRGLRLRHPHARVPSLANGLDRPHIDAPSSEQECATRWS